MFISKENKTQLLDYLEKKCEESSISKKTLGYTMRSYHISCPFIVMLLLFYGSQLIVTITAINLIGVFCCFILCNGCILTMLEHRLCGDEYTIADPFIEYIGVESNSRNRMMISFYIAVGYFIFFFLVYYYRFYYKAAALVVTAMVK